MEPCLGGSFDGGNVNEADKNESVGVDTRPDAKGAEPPAERVVVPEKSVDLAPDKMPAPVTSCGAPSAAFYDAPSTVPSQNGFVLKCESLGSQPRATLSLNASFAGSSAGFDVDLYRVMYVTRVAAGKFRPATMLLYVPKESNGSCRNNAPMVAVAHGTMGMAARCGPSAFPQYGLHHLAWPFVGRGAVVVAPDYVGLGTKIPEGHPYLVREPTVWSVTDGIRAAHGLMTALSKASCVQKRFLLVGHSQGGHAAVATAAMAARELPGFAHAGTIAIAPAFGDERVWLGPFQASLKTGEPTAYFLAYLLAASRFRNGPAPSTWLTPKAQRLVPGMLDSLCFTEWVAALLHNFPTFGDLFSASFLAASVSCQAGKGDCKAFQFWLDAVRDSQLPGFSTKAPTLFVQGGQDFVVSSTSVGCAAERLKKAGSPVSACYLPATDHIAVINASWPGIVPWIEAVLAGKTAPTTTGCVQTTLPACP